MRLPGAAVFVLTCAALGAALDARVALRGGLDFDLSRARAVVEKNRKPGDLFVHSPLFGVAELSSLGSIPGRPDRPSPELMNSRRILLLDVKAQPMFGFGAPSESIPIGEDLVLSIFEPEGGAAPVLFDLHANLARANMRIERPLGNVTSECNSPRSEGGRSCPGEPDWLYLASRTLNIQGRAEECVWAHPTTGGAIVIQIPPMPAPPPGRMTELAVMTAMDDSAVSGTPDGASVLTEIRQGNEALGRMVLENRLGWERTTVIIRPDEPIDLVITTARDGRRHHCINAIVREVEAQ